MTKLEVLGLLKKMKAYYPFFNLGDEEILNEWASKLKPYELEDVVSKFEEHLKGERADEPPKLHFLIKYLRTKEEKEKYKGDFLVRCNLCNQEMYLSEYENNHYKKCLLIKALIPILTARGEKVDYDILNQYDYSSLDKVWNKYNKPKKDMKEILQEMV